MTPRTRAAWLTIPLAVAAGVTFGRMTAEPEPVPMVPTLAEAEAWAETHMPTTEAMNAWNKATGRTDYGNMPGNRDCDFHGMGFTVLDPVTCDEAHPYFTAMTEPDAMLALLASLGAPIGSTSSTPSGNDGQVCADGWVSPSTGAGRCSHHGGVAR